MAYGGQEMVDNPDVLYVATAAARFSSAVRLNTYATATAFRA
jgi:hypothetical protein